MSDLEREAWWGQPRGRLLILALVLLAVNAIVVVTLYLAPLPPSGEFPPHTPKVVVTSGAR